MKHYTFFLLLLSSIILPLAGESQYSIENLKCDFLTQPIGIEKDNPSLSWKIKSQKRSRERQIAYQIFIADQKEAIDNNHANIWNSGKITSESSISVPTERLQMKSATTYYWKVKVWISGEKNPVWSQPSSWTTGILTKSDWNGACWIAYDTLEKQRRVLPDFRNKDNPNPPVARDVLPLFRRAVYLKKRPIKALLYICGLGQFEASINGRKVGDHFLDPGWTNFEKKALYVGFDVTSLLHDGNNAIGVMLGNGFFYIPKERYKKLTNNYGYPMLKLKLCIQYADGSNEEILSDKNWITNRGPITFSNIYGGEDYDARQEITGWNTENFKPDSSWKPCLTTQGPANLSAQLYEPIRITETFSPRKIAHPTNGKWVYDFGQNMSGIISITVKGKRGDSIRIYPGELLDTLGLTSQKATGSPFIFTYIMKGDGQESWQPKFSYYGFRYVTVEGAQPAEKGKDGAPEIISIQALHTENTATRIGHFHTSDTLFNRIKTLIDWSIRNNMVSILTDCPHREKLGWLEQLHLMGNAIHYEFDMTSLFKKIVEDMKEAQCEDGLIPEIAPEYTLFSGGFRDSPEWGSSGILLPWYMYNWYGDRTILKDSYPMIKKYLSYLHQEANGGILNWGLGDWYDLGPNRPGFSQLTPMGLTGTAIFYYDLETAEKIANILGENEDANTYHKEAISIKKIFNDSFFNSKTQQYGSGSQTANAMALYMNLVPKENRKAVVENLLKDIKAHDNSFTSGDIGFRYLLQVLSKEGYANVIYTMNSNSSVPGYGYQLKHGATALTESWQASKSVSNDHLMLGHILEWFYEGLAGIRQADGSIGYKTILFDPNQVKEVKEADASFESPYGKVAIKWTKTAKYLSMETEAPFGTTSRVYLPALSPNKITEGGKSIKNRKDIHILGKEKGKIILETGSGKYHFQTALN